MEKGCIMFWGRLDQNSGVHGNRKPPLTYNGENGVSTFSRDPILFILAGNEDMHEISDEFKIRPDRTTDYAVSCLECFEADWIKTLVSMATESPHWLIMGKMVSPPFLGCFWSDPFYTCSNEHMHKISDEFEFRPDWTTDYRVSCPWASKKFPIDL